MGRAPHVLSHFLGTRSLGTQCSLHYDACLEGWVWYWGALRPPPLPPPCGLLAGTCFLLWLLSLHGVTGAYPPPTASPLRREWVWLSLAWKRHRFETISPPAGFSMESSTEDITIYSAQCVYTAWCPPAFQESIPPAWGGRAQLSWGMGPRSALHVGGRCFGVHSTHLPLQTYGFLLLIFTLEDLPPCPKAKLCS